MGEHGAPDDTVQLSGAFLFAAGECYKIDEPPISERPVSSLVVNAVWRGMLQNEQIVTSAEGRHQRRSAAVGRLPVADVGVNHRI
jgi:hypothetical protein